MTVLSKEAFDELLLTQNTCDIFHPWSRSCLMGSIMVALETLMGSVKFSFILHSVRAIVNGKRKGRNFRNFFGQFVRLSLMGFVYGVLFFSGLCPLRNLISSRYYFYAAMFVPGMISGASIFCVEPSKRVLIVSSYANWALETIFNYFHRGSPRRFGDVEETFAFGLINAALMYFASVWTRDEKLNQRRGQMPLMWFFRPNVGDDNKCSHSDDSCTKNAIRNFLKYFSLGAFFNVLRMAAWNFKIAADLKLLSRLLFNKNTLKLATFAGSYVVIYNMCFCFLRNRSDLSREISTLISGFCSGLSYYIQPNVTIAMTALCNLIQIIWQYFNLTGKVFGCDFPVGEILFMILNGFLSHTLMAAPKYCSRFFARTISIATSGKSDLMLEAFRIAKLMKAC